MASQRDIKRRIRSIKNIAQITKAMQMVAAARMRRAQERVAAARPYSEHIRGIVADVSGSSGAADHPLLAERDVRNVELLYVTPNMGLAGPLVSNLNREALRLVRDTQQPMRVVVVGTKGRNFAARLGWNMVAAFTDIGDRPSQNDVAPIAQQVLDDYQNGTVDKVFLIYSQFFSTMRQQARVVQLLPVIPPEGSEQGESVESPWDYEPDNPQVVLSALLPRYVEFTIYQALLESEASVQSARMVAMSAATEAANDLVSDLTLLANKARQAEITKEISEISGAAEAMRTG